MSIFIDSVGSMTGRQPFQFGLRMHMKVAASRFLPLFNSQ
jgi:hypothetical protein